MATFSAVSYVVKSSPIYIVYCNSLCERCLLLNFTDRSNNSYDTSPTLMADYALEKRISFTIDSAIVHLECDTWCRRVKKRIVLAAAAVCCPDEFKIWLVLQEKKIVFIFFLNKLHSSLPNCMLLCTFLSAYFVCSDWQMFTLGLSACCLCCSCCSERFGPNLVADFRELCCSSSFPLSLFQATFESQGIWFFVHCEFWIFNPRPSSRRNREGGQKYLNKHLLTMKG